MEELMSSVEGFPVRTFLVPEKEQESMPKDQDYGGKCSGLFAWWNRGTSSWKTWQRCLTGGLMKFLGRWPKAGIMRNGIAYQRVPLAPPTGEIGSLLLPTPSATRYGSNKGGGAGRVGKERPSLETMAKLGTIPTPRSSDCQGGQCYRQPPSRQGGFGLKEITPGPLNPEYVEWLMGFPIGWTDLEHSETP